MHILMVARFNHDGKTRFVLDLSREVAHSGNRVALFMPGSPPSLKKYISQTMPGVTLLPEMDEKQILTFLSWEQVNVAHLHSPGEATLITRISRHTGIPYLVSVDGGFDRDQYEQCLKKAAALVTPDPGIYNRLSRENPEAYYFPEGVNPELYRQDERREFKVALIGSRESFSAESYFAIAKTVDLLGVNLEVISPLRPASMAAKYHGWLPFSGHILAGTEVTIASGRSAVEGLAGRNAVLLMGRRYRGILQPWEITAGTFDGFQGNTGAEPCYRDIFVDLSTLLKERARLKTIQDRGYSYIQRNCDLRLIAEHIVRLYMKALHQGNKSI